MGVLKQAKHYLPEACLKPLYSSIVEPYFRHCCSVRRTCGVTEKICLQKFENRATRIFTSSRCDAFNRPLIERLRWKTIDELINKESKTTVYKFLYALTPQYLCHLFTRYPLVKLLPCVIRLLTLRY